MQRSAAIAAKVVRRVLHAQPVPARGAFGIQTLHRPTGQILHRPSREAEVCMRRRREGVKIAAETPP